MLSVRLRPPCAGPGGVWEVCGWASYGMHALRPARKCGCHAAKGCDSSNLSWQLGGTSAMKLLSS
jgi:hypothetical protein